MQGRWNRIALTASLLALPTAGLLILWLWAGPGDTAAFATVATLILGIAVAIGPWALEGLADRDRARQLNDITEELAETVRRQWELEADMRHLRDPKPILLRWAPTDPRLVDSVVNLSPDAHAFRRLQWRLTRAGTLTGRLDRIVDAFVAIPRRRVVIIGEPGSGKTVLSIILILGLLARRQTMDPVPVLTSMASWKPQEETLLEWLSRHLAEEYVFLRHANLARELVLHRRILPLLDGLDELPEDSREAAIEAINMEGIQQPFVLTCRTREYTSAVRKSDILRSAEVLNMEPVNLRDAMDYLRQTVRSEDVHDRWEPLFAELFADPGAPLAVALSTPLIVFLVRTVYGHSRYAKPMELLDRTEFPSADRIREHLLTSWVPSVFQETDRRSTILRKWPRQRAIQWLMFLARELDRRRTRDFEWWRWTDTGPLTRVLIGVTVGFAFAWPLQLVLKNSLIDIALEWTVDPPLLAIAKNPVGLELFLAFEQLGGHLRLVGFVVGIVIAFAPALRPARMTWEWNRSVPRLALAGFVIGVAVGLGSTFPWHHLVATANGVPMPIYLAPNPGNITIGATLGIAVGSAMAATRGSRALPSPDESLTADRKAMVSSVLVLLIVFPLVVVVGYTIDYAYLGWSSEESIGLAIDIFVSRFDIGGLGGLMSPLLPILPVAIALNALRPSFRYEILHMWLVIRGRAPLRYMTFLGDCHRLGILRQVGAVYQFRHSMLQDCLAGRSGRPLSQNADSTNRSSKGAD